MHLNVIPHFQVFLFLKILRKFLLSTFVNASLEILSFQVMFKKYAYYNVLHLKVLQFRMVDMDFQIVSQLQMSRFQNVVLQLDVKLFL